MIRRERVDLSVHGGHGASQEAPVRCGSPGSCAPPPFASTSAANAPIMAPISIGDSEGSSQGAVLLLVAPVGASVLFSRAQRQRSGRRTHACPPRWVPTVALSFSERDRRCSGCTREVIGRYSNGTRMVLGWCSDGTREMIKRSGGHRHRHRRVFNRVAPASQSQSMAINGNQWQSKVIGGSSIG